jgi:hypothetical protein
MAPRANAKACNSIKSYRFTTLLSLKLASYFYK